MPKYSRKRVSGGRPRRVTRRLQGRYKRKAVYAGASVAAKVGSAALSNYLYGSSPAKKRRVIARRRPARRQILDRPRNLRVGRRGREKQSLATLYDALGPQMHAVERFSNGPLETNPGEQAGLLYAELSVSKVRELLKKSLDSRQYHAATDEVAGTGNTEHYWQDTIFSFLGGKVRHTFKNVCNQTATIEMYTCTPKRYTAMTPFLAWQFDLDKDHTVANAMHPIDQEMTTSTVGARPGATGYKFKDLFRMRFAGKRILEPGLEFHFTQNLPAFTSSNRYWEQVVDDPSVPALFTPHTQLLFVFVNGELVTDNHDNGINYGSVKIGHVAERHLNYRAFKFVKRHQHYFTDSLDKEFTSQVHINPQNEAITPYAEEQL